ncbi:MAG: exo-alpha-sialidase, partial [Lentisphaerae bacterium]|nr:exo-alpha-sialidase [Lentisphaerota bacterium]
AGGPAQPDKDGIITLDIVPWSPDHPRHDHQLIFSLKDGRLMLVWSEYYVTGPTAVKKNRYAVTHSDKAPCRISGKVSADKGRTWSETFTIQDNIGVENVKHPNLLRLPSGEVIFLFTVWNSARERVIYQKRSTNDCESWTAPEKIEQLPGFNNINNDHIFQLKSGRIVLPAFNTPVIWEKGEHCLAFCYYSDDSGKTWNISKNRIDMPKRGAEEPSMLELKDGSLLALIRTSMGAIYRAKSTDGGETWSEPETTGLKAPASPPLVKRIPSTGELLLIWNHNYEPELSHQGRRTPLSSAISKDEGATWENIRNIEVVPEGSAAYAAATFVGNEALVTYYYQPKGMGGESDIRLKIIPVEWFYAK